MPLVTGTPYAEGCGNARMSPLASTTAGKQHGPAHSFYPLVNVNETQGSNGGTATPCTTPYRTSSPLRYSHAGGRGGCYVSHHSAASFFNCSNNVGGVNAGVSHHSASFPSNELQEYISMTSPASDFYFYSPQPFYLESPAPCAAAELYGGGSVHSASCTPNGAAPQVLGPYCHNADPVFTPSNGGTAAAGANTPSLMSSISFGGSRFPQWYLPRGFYGSPMAAPVTGNAGGIISPAPGVYKGSSLYGYAAASTAVSVSMQSNSVEEDVLSCEENFTTPGTATVSRCAQDLPVPPRLSPQYNSTSVGPLALPPSVLGTEHATPHVTKSAYQVQSHYGAARSFSADASPAPSPTCRPRWQPQFVPYDGRAYGLPMHQGISRTDAVTAIARSVLVAEMNVNKESSSSHHQNNHHTNGNSAHCMRSGMQRPAMTGGTSRHDPRNCVTSSSTLKPEAACGSKNVCEQTKKGVPLNSPKKSMTTAPIEGAAAGNDAGEVVDAYSPREKALLVDAHTRLARRHAKAQEEQQKMRAAMVLTSAENDSSIASASAANGRQTVVSLADKDGVTEAKQRLNDSAHSAGDETDIPISPIPHLPGDEDVDTARLEDSMLDEMNLSQRQLTEVVTDGNTGAVLEQVLSLRGVKWRHDPYSRRVLAQPSSLSSAEEETANEEEREESREKRSHTPLSSESEGTHPNTVPRGQQPLCDVTARKRPTPDGSSRTVNESTTFTQPPTSPIASQCAQSSNDSSADNHHHHHHDPMTQPSVRRMPIKKVCVRHFVSGKDGDLSCSADGAVGVLASVVSRLLPTRPAVSAITITATTATTKKSQEDTLTEENEPLVRNHPSVNLTLSVLDHQESIDVMATAASSSAPRTARPQKKTSPASVSPLVPPPRSKQQVVQRDVCEGAAIAQRASTSSSGSTVTTVGAAATSFSASSGTAPVNTSHTSSMATSGSTISSGTKENANPAPLADTAVRQAGPYSSSSPAVLSADAGEPRLTSCAWMAQPPQRSLTVSSSAATKLASSVVMAYNWSHTPVSATSGIDTRLLVQLWRRLDSSGCFRDVLEARQRKLGAESNSSTRVMTRNLMRRFCSRNSANGEEENGSRSNRTPQQQQMLTEAEVTHVCVLRHRYRTSCAVATRRFECGTEVVVDGDMGVDTGVVVLVMTKAEYHALSPMERRLADLAPELPQALTASIHRPITAEEQLLRNEAQKPLEDATLEFVRYLATQPHLFQSCRIECMNFVEVEFQADGQKLYVYYQTSSAVRFLELATYLNHVFHCRIWMKMAKGC